MKTILKEWAWVLDEFLNYKPKITESQVSVIRCVPIKQTGIILVCIVPVKENKKYNLVTEKSGEVLDTGLTAKQASKKMAEYENEAKKAAMSLDQYLSELINFRRFGFKIFKFARRFDDHLEFGHITIQIVNRPKRLPDGSLNPNYLGEIYEYVIGKGGRTRADILSNQNFIVKNWGGSHNFKNIDNVNVRVATPKESLSGNIASFKLPTGETVRKVQLEYYIKEINTWKLKGDPTTMWPSSWDLTKIKSVIKEATENIYKHIPDKRLFRGITQEGYKVEFYINPITKEIETAYLIF